MRPVHYYHVWLGDSSHESAWKSAAEEHFAALRWARFEGKVRVGLVGTRGSEDAAASLDAWWPGWSLCARAESGFEMVTIAAMHEECKLTDPTQAVLYAHTKGANADTSANRAWRRSMTRRVVSDWRSCVYALEEYDAVGLHWLTAARFPHVGWGSYFGGNFFWARAGYLARLPPVGQGGRYDAEVWIGQGAPRVLDLLPGWPRY